LFAASHVDLAHASFVRVAQLQAAREAQGQDQARAGCRTDIGQRVAATQHGVHHQAQATVQIEAHELPAPAHLDDALAREQRRQGFGHHEPQHHRIANPHLHNRQTHHRPAQHGLHMNKIR
jgi:hypothetical protein